MMERINQNTQNYPRLPFIVIENNKIKYQNDEFRKIGNQNIMIADETYYPVKQQQRRINNRQMNNQKKDFFPKNSSPSPLIKQRHDGYNKTYTVDPTRKAENSCRKK